MEETDCLNLENHLIRLSLSLYNNVLISRKVVQFVIDSYNSLIIDILFPILMQMVKEIKDTDQKVLEQVEQVFSVIKDQFGYFATEHQRLQVYKNKSLMKDPVENILLQSDSKNHSTFSTQLSWTLKLLLETPGVLKLAEDNIQLLRSENQIMFSFIQGDLWKLQEAKFEGKSILPLFIYNDDIESENALGSHARTNKLGAIYFSIPCFLKTSTLRNNFFPTLYHTDDSKRFGNSKIYNSLIHELNELCSTGLILKADGKQRVIHFQLGLIIGDGLGLNSMLGFQKPFSSNCPCRICKSTIHDVRTSTTENKNLLRNMENYQADVNLKNFATTGILEKSVFDSVINYNTVESPCVDFVHDWAECVVPVTMAKICNDLIYEFKYIELEELNAAIKELEDNNFVISDRIPNIKKKDIMDAKRLKMSAAESLLFSKYFGIIMVDRIQQTKNFGFNSSDSDSDLQLYSSQFGIKTFNWQKVRKIWKLYKTLRQVVNVLICPNIHIGDLRLALEHKMTRFLELFSRLYGHFPLKFHNAIHARRVMAMNGNLVESQAGRYESKRRLKKQITATFNAQKNLPKTICLKSQLQLAYWAFTGTFFSSEPGLAYDSCEPISERTKRVCFPKSAVKEEIFETERLTYKGTKYEFGMFVVTEIQDSVFFGRIENIFIKNNEVFFLIRRYRTIYYDDDVDGYL